MDRPRQPARPRQASRRRPRSQQREGRAEVRTRAAGWARYGRLASKIVGGLAAVIGLLLGITSLIDWLSDKVGQSSPPPPASIDARIDALRLASVRQPLADYLQASGQSTAGLTPFE